ncbi:MULTISPECIES: DUF1931 family protein [Actinomadura]|uniref:DUF1931 family protein n=1 Tax=Actinomadura madurae TaxID=1993 RepID=A0A1I5GG80_9ACTN|nr:DUF1931 family protein [Actinomadura madurae]SFO34920.1 protein of unknown function [Actinomadura madurae]SPT51303.1 Domain of uncharacterised function (DUF1931) [Actinomadura madurae]
MAVIGISRFERFFRAAAGLDVDKNDLRRYHEFLDAKLYDLLLNGQAKAKANGRDIIEPFDLPITKGLQESIHRFRRLDEEIEVEPILELLARRPPLDLAVRDATDEKLPEIAGGLSYALSQAFRIMFPDRRNPQTTQWERVQRMFDLLL